MQGEADPLQQKNTELLNRLSNYERKKKQEIYDLTIHLKELQHAVTLLSKDLEKKDKKIAEMKTLFQKLSDKKRDGSSELARALHEKDAEIEELTQLLHSKSQSKAMLVVKQELDATKVMHEWCMLFGIGYMTLCVHALASNRFTLIPQVSHDELVQYIGSMERQVADTEVRTLQVLTITVYS